MDGYPGLAHQMLLLAPSRSHSRTAHVHKPCRGLPWQHWSELLWPSTASCPPYSLAFSAAPGHGPPLPPSCPCAADVFNTGPRPAAAPCAACTWGRACSFFCSHVVRQESQVSPSQESPWLSAALLYGTLCSLALSSACHCLAKQHSHAAGGGGDAGSP